MLGGLDQVISVDTLVAQLQADSPGGGTTIGRKKVVDLPLNGRKFVQLTQLIPAVNPGTFSSMAARRGRGSIGQSDAKGGLTATQINGQRDRQDRYFIPRTNRWRHEPNPYLCESLPSSPVRLTSAATWAVVLSSPLA